MRGVDVQSRRAQLRAGIITVFLQVYISSLRLKAGGKHAREIIVFLLSDEQSCFGGVCPHVALFFFLISKRRRQRDDGLKSTLPSSVFFFFFPVMIMCPSNEKTSAA